MLPSWAVYVGAVVAAIALYLSIDSDGAQSLLYNGHSLVAAVIVAVQTWRRRPMAQAAWYLIAAGLGALSLGEWTWSAYEYIGHRSVAFPSLIDPIYLSGAVLLALGMWRLVAARGTARGDLQDTAIVTMTVGLFTWVEVLGPSWHGATQWARVVALAYPISSALLVAAAFRLLLGRIGRTPAGLLIAVGMTAELVADAIYAHQMISGSYVEGGWLDAGWMVAYGSIAAAALHASSARLGRPAVAPAVTLTTRRLALLMGVIAGAPLALLIPGGPSYPAFIVVWLAVLALAAARLTILVRGLGGRVLRDELTGLPNRVAFGERLQAAITDLDRDGGHVGVVFCDVDNFKLVNDSYGHAIGDQVLRAVGERLVASVRPGDVVARLGGDEFALLVSRVSDPSLVRTLADRVLGALAEPLRIRGFGELYTGVSVGVRTSSDPDARADVLLADADMAMYRAKDGGGGRQAEFHPTLRTDARRWLHLHNDLRAALERDELHLVYQPEVEVATGLLFGVEALARWQHATLGAIPPGEFIPVAEVAGLIERIFDWSLDQALHQHAEWRSQGRTVPVAVNLSARQLTDPRLVAVVAAALQRHGVGGDQLWIELTESALAGGDAAVRAVTELKQLGVFIAIDDFGTGYSSLSQLRLLPFDLLKIDRSFIARLGHAPADEHVVASIIQLAHSLGVRTVAEGVETPAQADILAALGCDVVQGYLYARPGGPGDVLALVGRDGAWLGRSVARGTA